MSKWQCPKSEVGSCIRDRSKHELNCFNKLVYEDIWKRTPVSCIIRRFLSLQVFNFVVCDCFPLIRSPITLNIFLLIFYLLKEIFSLSLIFCRNWSNEWLPFLVSYHLHLLVALFFIIIIYGMILKRNVVSIVMLLCMKLIHLVYLKWFHEKHCWYTN